MNRDLANYRKIYDKEALLEKNLPDHPMELFKSWFDIADAHKEVEEANAMTLSTMGEDGFPKGRIVLLKEFHEDGFVFYTNYDSEKGKAILSEPNVSLSFFWPPLQQQIIVKGIAEKTSKAISDSYFNKRPLGSRLGAIASNQSGVIENRAVLEEKLSELQERYKEEPPKRPDYWGGFLVKPISFEFWQGRPNRLHDRILYTQEENDWNSVRLAP